MTLATSNRPRVSDGTIVSMRYLRSGADRASNNNASCLAISADRRACSGFGTHYRGSRKFGTHIHTSAHTHNNPTQQPHTTTPHNNPTQQLMNKPKGHCKLGPATDLILCLLGSELLLPTVLLLRFPLLRTLKRSLCEARRRHSKPHSQTRTAPRPPTRPSPRDNAPTAHSGTAQQQSRPAHMCSGL